MKKSAIECATDFVNACKDRGWNYEVRGSIITITKKIKPSDNEDFCKADMEYYGIFSNIPRTSAGSTWGTDGGGIGAMSAMNSGMFKMNMSGGSKRVLNAIGKIKK